MTARKTMPLLLLLSLTLFACNLFANVPPGLAATATSMATPMPSDTPLLLTATPQPETLTPTSAPTSTPTEALTSTETPTPAQTMTPTPELTMTSIPTYVKLRGEVNTEHVSCRYGPGAPYLYKYGLVGGSNLEVLGRAEVWPGPGAWIEVQAIGGDNPCWMNAKYMNIKGDVSNAPPINPEDVILPQSPYYGPVTDVNAVRNGSQVTISWTGITLKAGDDSLQFPYLVEAWVCNAGQLVFTPTGTYALQVSLTDEAGCAAPSHGRVYAVEKHGYTNWVKISWPQP